MNILKYGYFGEDEAHRIFLEKYLEQLVKYLNLENELIFDFDLEFTYRFKARNKSDVDKLFAEAVQQGFISYQQDIFFVGRDLDTFLSSEFVEKSSSMNKQLGDKFRDKTFLMIPVQCIEHWLWYLKTKAENPTSTKNVSLESKPNKEAKIALYGSAKVSNNHSIPIVQELTNVIDIPHLESCSISFNAFHKQVIKFITNLS
ncbi:MAG: hypothetical protein ACOVOW_05260 [Spirosomataceae bacterium]